MPGEQGQRKKNDPGSLEDPQASKKAIKVVTERMDVAQHLK